MMEKKLAPVPKHTYYAGQPLTPAAAAGVQKNADMPF